MIDAGVNLGHPSFSASPETLAHLIQECRSHGVTGMVAIGTDLEDSTLALGFARKYPGFLVATAGIHPHDAKSFHEADVVKLEELLSAPEVLAIGEMGLDFNRNYSPPEQQEWAFARQLEINSRIRKPLYLHQRDAHDRQLEMLSAHRDAFDSGIAHCFTGTTTEMRDYLEMGLYIGVTGWLCDERRGQALQEAVRSAPLDRLIVETDAPFLLPRTIRPRPKRSTNYPWHVKEVIEMIAEIRKSPVEKVKDQLNANFIQLFGQENLSRVGFGTLR